jgi:hypothetical protein
VLVEKFFFLNSLNFDLGGVLMELLEMLLKHYKSPRVLPNA